MLYLIFLLIITFSTTNFTQINDTLLIEQEEKIDDIFDDLMIEDSETDIYNLIEQFLLNPVDINSAELQELKSIPFIDYTSAKLILEHRKKFGKFISKNELFSVQGLDIELVEKILPFLTVEENTAKINGDIKIDKEENWLKEFFNFNIQIRNRLNYDLQKREGFKNGKYLGSPLKSFNRIILKQSKKFQIGVITDKDAGENSFTDFLSYHISIQNYGFIKNLILGDYNLEIGQGLILWSSYAFSKGTDAIIPIKRKSKNIRPYTSATEYGFFRGAAISIKLSDLTLSSFYSSKGFDASIDSLSQEIKSIYKTGLHLTKRDLLNKNSAKEIVVGSRLEYEPYQNNKFGVTIYNSNLSHPLQKNNSYDIYGNKFLFYSFDFDNRFGLINIFGEIANDSKETAFYSGLIISPTSKINFATSVRYYPANFNNLHSYAFGEQSGKTKNEIGIYSGIKYNSNLGLFSIYFDKFKFPHSTFENPVPSIGDELYVSYRKKLMKELEIHLRFKNENKEVTERINNQKIISERIRNSYRAEFDYILSKNLKLRTRLEMNTYTIKKINLFEKGFLAYEDIKYTPSKNLSLYGRIIFFETQSFNSTVYEFENDLTGVFSNVALYGEGIRYYFLVKYKLHKNFIISFKYAETYKPNEKFLSSGNNKIEGNIDNRIGLQLDVKL